jgi:hypothetical protein
MAYPAQQSGTSAAVASAPTYSTQGSASGQNLEHPPGYHQNENASEPDKYQRAAMQAHKDTNYRQQSLAEDDGVWGAAKKWAHSTGEVLAAAETEVWKRINKE